MKKFMHTTKRFTVGLVVFAFATQAFAQTQSTAPAQFSPPPMVPSSPPPMPPAEPNTPPSTMAGQADAPTAAPNRVGTPPPPSLTPSASGYQYSPYGQPRAAEKPGPEVGLMVSEGLFGMLTAAGIVVLPYFLLFNQASGGGIFGGLDKGISWVIFAAIFAAVPLAVAQTQVGLANGSRNYFSEMWPAALVGLAGQAAVIGLYALSIGTDNTPGATSRGAGPVVLLFAGAIAVVPLMQMAAINLFKQPKMKFAGLNYKPGEGLALGVPLPAPLFAQTSQGLSVGMQMPLINMRF